MQRSNTFAYLDHLYASLSQEAQIILMNRLNDKFTSAVRTSTLKDSWILLRLKYDEFIQRKMEIPTSAATHSHNSQSPRAIGNTAEGSNESDIEKRIEIIDIRASDIGDILLVELRHIIKKKDSGKNKKNKKKSSSTKQASNSHHNDTSTSSRIGAGIVPWIEKETTEIYINICFPTENISKFIPKPIYPNRKVEGDMLIHDITGLWTKSESKLYGQVPEISLHFFSIIISELITIFNYHLLQAIESIKYWCENERNIHVKIIDGINKRKLSELSPIQSIDLLRNRLRDRVPMAVYTKLDYPTITEMLMHEVKGYCALFPPKYFITPLWVIKFSPALATSGSRLPISSLSERVDASNSYIRVDNSTKCPITLEDALSKVTDMHYYATFVLYDTKEEAIAAALTLIEKYHRDTAQRHDGEIHMSSSSARNRAISVDTPILQHNDSDRDFLSTKDRSGGSIGANTASARSSPDVSRSLSTRAINNK